MNGAHDAASGTLVAFDRHSRGRLDGRAGAAAAIRVLVADGQALVRAGFRALLEAGGQINVVGEASTGEEAVALARSLRPDVVLIDATLPGLNCVEATGRILADPGIAVMLLTATELDERIFAMLRAGARGLLLKDTDPAELVRAIELLAGGDAMLSPPLTRRLIAELASVPDPQLPSSELLDELTPREREVVALVALGLSNADIAERLVISPATSKTHVSRAMLKLGAHDRAQLVVFAFHAGLAVPRAEAAAPRRWRWDGRHDEELPDLGAAATPIGRAVAPISLTEAELAELDEAAPVGTASGDRYPAGQMSTLTQ